MEHKVSVSCLSPEVNGGFTGVCLGLIDFFFCCYLVSRVANIGNINVL
ncbi:hypothetical protein [Paenibacillus terrae]